MTILIPMRCLLLCTLFTLSAIVSAQVYKIVNPDGTISYSDRPEEGAEEVDVPDVQTYEGPTNLDSIGSSTGKEEYPEYTTFEVIKPKHDETFRDNGGYVAIQVSVQPGLFREHIIALYMDGEDLGSSGRGTSIILQNVDRGSHTVHAVIRDADGKQVERTDGVTFHLHRNSILN